MSQKRKIKVLPYDPKWKDSFDCEALTITKALGDNCVAIHHIGSTSIPGLSAKPKIDIIAVVKELDSTLEALEKTEFKYTGEWNIPFKYGFSKREGMHVNLHVFEEGHPSIELNLMFRDYLRTHDEARDTYAAIKNDLLTKESSFHLQEGRMFSGYNLGKDVFIRKILNEAGFSRMQFLKCVHHREWEEYQRIEAESIFPRGTSSYVQNDINDENHTHFILCKGTEIISIAQVERQGNQSIIHKLATDKKEQGKGFGSSMLSLIEKWCHRQGSESVIVPASSLSKSFFTRREYEEWDSSEDENLFVDGGVLLKKALCL